MKGSVRKKRKNAWSYRIDLGTVDGKRKQVEKGGFKTEREATKAMQDVLYHLNNTGDYVENKKISFHTVYEEFIEREGKATRAYATLKKYDSLYRNHIFNLIDMAHSDCYNPFAYLHTDVDAFRLINTLIQNTTPQKSQTSDPFWDSATRSLTVKSQRTNNKIPLFG